MAFSPAVFLLVLSVIAKCVTANQVPVFLWGDVELDLIRANPLNTLGSDLMRGLLKQELSDAPFTVVFVEETLSVEDFSLKNDGGTSYPYLESTISKAAYLPAADRPLEVLMSLGEDEDVDHVKLTDNGLSADINSKNSHFLFIYLNDAKDGESRAALLRRHDDFMRDMVGKLGEKYDKIAAIYTARYPSWTVSKRVRREVTVRNDTTGQFIIVDNFMMYVNNVVVVNHQGNPTQLSEGTNATSSFENNTLEVSVEFGSYVVKMDFSNGTGYWYFDKVVLTDNTNTTAVVSELLPVETLYAFDGFSYRCGGSVVFESHDATGNATDRNDYVLSFNNIKIQPFLADATANTTVFGDSLNCVGFFSIPIWSSLFIIFLVLSVTFYGIMMMMDIRSMDRFDDPKGKTITINASE